MNKTDVLADLPNAHSLVGIDADRGLLPLCSVCIANYNGMAVIDACIRSVMAQDCAFAVEIVVHDDASTDGSVEHIRQCYPDVTLLANNPNAGFCISNNRMADIARGDFLLLLNNDAELLPDALQTLHDYATGQQTPAILGLPQYDAQSGSLIDIGSHLDFFLNPIPNLDPGETEIAMVSGACLWIPRVLWHEFGGFPSWFGSIAEDTYLCCLARLQGYRVEAVPRSGYRHWVGSSLGGGKVVENKLRSNASRRVTSERNKNFVMFMLYPSPAFHLILPVHVMLLLAEGAILALIKRDFSVFTAIYLASLRTLWSNRGVLRGERKRLQTTRRVSARRFFSVFRAFPHKFSLLLSYGIPDIR
ncbi:MAG TPA: glycosyltransferase [Burkholderiaceae bacterium]